MTYFEPQSEAEHRRGNLGYDVPDYCANCNRPLHDHHNGECPADESEVAQ